MSKFGETVSIQAAITQYNGVRMTLHYDVFDKATRRGALHRRQPPTASSIPTAIRRSCAAAGRNSTPRSRPTLPLKNKDKQKNRLRQRCFPSAEPGFLYLCLLDIIHRNDLAVPYGRIADPVFRAGADRFSDLMVRLAGVDRYAVRSGRIIAL